MDKPLFEYLLRLGDTDLVLAQRLSAWCGHGPILEEDLALTNTALDLLGQARMWLSLAAQVEDAGRDEDQLAYLREAHEFRNLLLVERPNGNYADTMARQFFFDVWHYFLLQRLALSSDTRIAAIAAKSVKEVAYHARRSSDLAIRLGDGTPESHSKMQAAIDHAWPYTGELFADDAVDAEVAGRGLGSLGADVRDDWLAHVRQTCDEATLVLPGDDVTRHIAYQGGRQGRHTESLGFLLAEMQVLHRAYPGASW